MGLSIGPTIGIAGEQEYRAAIRRIIEEHKTLNTELENSEQRFSKYDTELKKNATRFDNLNQKLQAAREEQSIASDAVEKATVKYREQEEALRLANQKYQDIKNTLPELTAQVEKQAQELENENNTYSILRESLAEAKEEYKQLSATKRESGEASRTAKRDLDGLVTGLKELKVNVTTSEIAMKAAKNALTDTETEYGKATANVNRLKDALPPLQAEFDKQRAKLDSAKATYEAQKTAVDKAITAHQKLSDEYGRNSAQAQGAKNALMQLKEGLREAKNNVTEASASFKEADGNLRSVQKELREAESNERKLANATAMAKTEFDKTSSTLESAKKEYDDHSKKVEEAKTKYEGLAKAYEENSEKAKEARQAQEGLKEGLKAQKAVVDSASDSLKDAQKELNGVSEAEKEVGRKAKAFQDSGRIVEEWKGKLAEAEQEVFTLEQQMKNMPTSLDLIGDKMLAMGDKISDFGDMLSKYVTVPLTALATMSVKEAGTFQDGMAKIYTIADESIVPMSEMREQLMALSDAMGFDLDDLAEATYQTVSAAVSTENAMGFMEDATRLARAGFTTTTEAVDVLTTAINAYGLEAEDASKIADMLLKTQNDGKTVVNELAQSMGTVIPTAAAYGVGIDQLSTAYVLMTKQGINTARSTTFLNAMFTELERESSKVSKTLEDKTGKSFAELMEDGNSLGDVLGILYDSVGRDDEAFARLWANVRAGRGGIALVNGGIEAFNEELVKIQSSTGQVDSALETLETPALKARRALTQLKNTTVELGETIIAEFYPYFEKIVGAVKSATDWFKNLDDASKEQIVNYGLMAMATGPVIKGLGSLVGGIGKTVKGVKKLSGNMMEFGEVLFDSGHETLGLFIADLGFSLPGLALLATEVAAVGGAFVGMGVAAWNMQKKIDAGIEAEYGMREEWQKSLDTADQLIESYQARKEEIASTVDATYEEAMYAQTLVEQYNSLIDANGQVKEGSEYLADTIINELCGALGMQYDDVMALIEQNGQFAGSMQEVIDKMILEAQTAAYKEYLVEAYKQQIAVEKELETQENALWQANMNLVDAQREQQQALADYTAYYDPANKETEKYADALEMANRKVAEAKATQTELQTSFNETTEALSQAESDILYYSDRITANVTENANKTVDAIDSGGDRAVSAAESASKRVEAGFSPDGVPAANGFIDGWISKLRERGHAMADAAEYQANQITTRFNGALSVNSPSKETYESGKWFIQGFVNALNDNGNMMSQAASSLAYDALSGFDVGSYIPNANGETTTYNKTVSAPINVVVNIDGNANDPDAVGKSIADKLSEVIAREREVFA